MMTTEHRIPFRYPQEYENYLEHLMIRTTLDRSKIIRLALHTAVQNPIFLAEIERHVKPHRRNVRPMQTAWSEKDHLWKTGKTKDELLK